MKQLYWILVFLLITSSRALYVAAQEIPPLTEEEKHFIEDSKKIFETELAKQRQAELDRLVVKLSSNDFTEQFRAVNSLQIMDLPIEQGLPLFRKLIDNKAPIVRAGAIRALATYGSKAREITPLLIETLQNDAEDNVKAEAIYALGVIAPTEPQVLNALARALPKADERSAIAIVQTIAQGGTAALAFQPILLDTLNSPWREVRYAAYMALGQLSKGTDALTSEAALNKLENFEQQTPVETAAAFLILQKPGQAAKNEIPRLLNIFQSRPEVYVQQAVIKTLEVIGPGSNEQAVNLLIETFASKDEVLSTAAKHALQEIKDGDAAAVEPLTAALSHPSLRVRYLAAETIANVGSAAKSAAPALSELLGAEIESPEPQSRYLSVYITALISTTTKSADVINTLANLLISTSTMPRDKANLTQPYLFAVLSQLGLPSDKVQRTKILQTALDALKVNDPYLVAAAANVVRTMGPEAKSAVPLLIQILKSDVLKDAIMTHIFEPSMMPMPGATIKNRPFLDKHQHGHQHHSLTTARLEAINALAKIGPSAVAAIPVLKEYAQAKDDSPLSFFREDARRALDTISA